MEGAKLRRCCSRWKVHSCSKRRTLRYPAINPIRSHCCRPTQLVWRTIDAKQMSFSARVSNDTRSESRQMEEGATHTPWRSLSPLERPTLRDVDRLLGWDVGACSRFCRAYGCCGLGNELRDGCG